ncbi:MAG: hypothetical protein RLZZ592_2563 [Pseudomonadota bacterium]
MIRPEPFHQALGAAQPVSVAELLALHGRGSQAVLLRHPAAFAWWRLWIAAMAVVIFLPLPFGNVLPGLSLVLLGLGWMYRDGLLLMLSLPAGLGAIAFGWFSAGLIVDTAAAAGQQVMGWL